MIAACEKFTDNFDQREASSKSDGTDQSDESDQSDHSDEFESLLPACAPLCRLLPAVLWFASLQHWQNHPQAPIHMPLQGPTNPRLSQVQPYRVGLIMGDLPPWSHGLQLSLATPMPWGTWRQCDPAQPLSTAS